MPKYLIGREVPGASGLSQDELHSICRRSVGLLRALASPRCPRLLHAELEASVWDAARGSFIALCRNVDERVIFAQFFDDVRRLQSFVDFRCHLQVSVITS